MLEFLVLTMVSMGAILDAVSFALSGMNGYLCIILGSICSAGVYTAVLALVTWIGGKYGTNPT